MSAQLVADRVYVHAGPCACGARASAPACFASCNAPIPELFQNTEHFFYHDSTHVNRVYDLELGLALHMPLRSI